MATTKPQTLSAQTLVGLLCGLMRMDMLTVARVAGVPQKNMKAWIAGKRQALRLSSIVAILHTVGVRIEALRTVLDAQRVHFWEMTVPAAGSARQCMDRLTDLSGLFKSGFITEVVHARRTWRQRWFRRYFLIDGMGRTDQPCKVVITLRTYPWRKVGISPEVLKGAAWRDDNRHHQKMIDAEAWKAVTSQDMTPREFTEAFEDSSKKLRWSDVILMAREFGVVAEEVAAQMMETHGKEEEVVAATPEKEGVPVRFLLGYAA